MRELLTRQENLKYRLILEGIAVGLLAGLVSSAFRWTLMEAEDIRNLFLRGRGRVLRWPFWASSCSVCWQLSLASS